MKQALEPCSTWKAEEQLCTSGGDGDGGVWLSETAPKATLLPWDSCSERTVLASFNPNTVPLVQPLCRSPGGETPPPGVWEAKARLRLRTLLDDKSQI